MRRPHDPQNSLILRRKLADLHSRLANPPPLGCDMVSHDKLERIVQGTVIFSVAMLGAASGSLFRPEWPAIATAGIVALGVMALLAHQRHA
jgi:hypothetical protein